MCNEKRIYNTIISQTKHNTMRYDRNMFFVGCLHIVLHPVLIRREPRVLFEYPREVRRGGEGKVFSYICAASVSVSEEPFCLLYFFAHDKFAEFDTGLRVALYDHVRHQHRR